MLTTITKRIGRLSCGCSKHRGRAAATKAGTTGDFSKPTSRALPTRHHRSDPIRGALADVHERPILITARKVIGSNSTRRERVLWFHFMNARVSGTAYGMERGGNC